MDAENLNLNGEKRKLFYTPDELINAFPEVRLFGWNANKIGVFFNGHLLSGYTCGSDKRAMIWIDSFERLVNFANTVEEQRKVFFDQGNKIEFGKKLFYTPDELIREFPAVGLFGWNANKLGVFFNSRLLSGYTSGSGKRAMIWDRSFKRLVEFANTVEEQRKVNLFRL